MDAAPGPTGPGTPPSNIKCRINAGHDRLASTTLSATAYAFTKPFFLFRPPPLRLPPRAASCALLRPSLSFPRLETDRSSPLPVSKDLSLYRGSALGLYHVDRFYRFYSFYWVPVDFVGTDRWPIDDAKFEEGGDGAESKCEILISRIYRVSRDARMINWLD